MHKQKCFHGPIIVTVFLSEVMGNPHTFYIVFLHWFTVLLLCRITPTVVYLHLLKEV